MNGCKGNYLTVVENGRIAEYCLDDKKEWSLGRADGENIPDIRLESTTISRQHGTFGNIDGLWVYFDNYGKNGTVMNGKPLNKGIGGLKKAEILQDGDVFVFGGAGRDVICRGTVWAYFFENSSGHEWRRVDTRDCTGLIFSAGTEKQEFDNPEKGMVLEFDEGTVIYMGNYTFLSGNARGETN